MPNFPMPSSGFKKYFSNTVWMVGGRLCKAVLGFVVGIFVARYLGPERFGVFNYAIGLSALFSVFGAMGLDSVLVRELVRQKNNRNMLLGSALSIRFLGSIFGFFMTVFFLWWTQSDHETWLLTLICAASFFLRPFDVLRGFFESEVKAKYIVMAEGGQIIISSLLRIYFIAVKANVAWFAICWLSEWVLIAVGFIVLYRVQFGRLASWRVDKKTVTYLLREGFPLILSSVAIIAYLQIDKVMLKNMLGMQGNEQIGLYSVALRIMPFVLIIPQMLSKALAPSLISVQRSNFQKYKVRSQLFMDVMAWTGIGLSVALFFLAKPLIFLYGKNYYEAIPLLKIIAWKGLFSSLSIASGLLIITEGLQKWSVLRNLAGCAINIGMNWLLIPQWEALGAAYATLVSMIVSSFLAHAIIPAYRPIFKVQILALLSGFMRLVSFGLKNVKNWVQVVFK